ncbi:MAG: CBS domain-containing protein, partial [Proteobacteria bacterium]|nr:CBS domain-containing protein [Pseudomonadota bacterium]
MESFFSKIGGNGQSEFLVRDIMTSKVFVLHENDNLDVAKLLMGEAHIRHIPVVTEDDRFVGLLTHRDLLKLSIS